MNVNFNDVVYVFKPSLTRGEIIDLDKLKDFDVKGRFAVDGDRFMAYTVRISRPFGTEGLTKDEELITSLFDNWSSYRLYSFDDEFYINLTLDREVIMSGKVSSYLSELELLNPELESIDMIDQASLMYIVDKSTGGLMNGEIS